jgi:hypothetical protein
LFWNGVSDGFLKVGNTRAAIAAYEEEHVAAVSVGSTPGDDYLGFRD